MKKIIWYLLISLFVTACATEKNTVDAVRKTPKFKLIPPGTVWLKDNIFIDISEVRNFDILEFLHWNKRSIDSITYKSFLPDTQCWNKYDTKEAYENLYLRHPSFREYPAVGLTYKQAVEYCKWRTDRVNEYLIIKAKKLKKRDYINNYDTIVKLHKEIPDVIRYRLPTEEEWEYAANAGIKSNCGYESLVDKHKRPFMVTKEYRTIYHHDFFYEYTKDVRFGKPNKYGIYNMMGNVSEFVMDSTIVKGLNFDTYIDSNNIKSRFINEAPSVKIGFRCIAEIIK
ncbi:MAG: hypothetical protein A2X12_09400 [Bacteroidetes bacterium GWE2_29_8]|nr:MAG: hypothetical protein A2X12_09400 [Bacteroidetes bacterium GWE2_29_8]OFY17985.1 MAG: hypothetical protein A2X02_04935 [Bacteroidetes bacterium GWF2_29_10]